MDWVVRQCRPTLLHISATLNTFLKFQPILLWPFGMQCKSSPHFGGTSWLPLGNTCTEAQDREMLIFIFKLVKFRVQQTRQHAELEESWYLWSQWTSSIGQNVGSDE